MPEFHAEPYVYLPAVSHKSALIAWGAFYFRTNTRGKWKIVDDDDLRYVHPPRKDSIGAQSAPYGPARVEVYDNSGAMVALSKTEVSNHCWVSGLMPDSTYTYKVFVKGQEWAAGERFHLAALPAFADAEWTLGDLGCGTGQLTAALAPFVARVIAVDGSAAMLQAAKRRLQGLTNVDLRRGELEALPIDDARLDAATMALVLHHLPEPDRALREVARVLKPGGRLLIVDMLPHDRESYRQQMGHVWLGFSEEHVRRILDDSGFGEVRIVPLSPDPKSKGPGLFVATAKKG